MSKKRQKANKRKQQRRRQAQTSVDHPNVIDSEAFGIRIAYRILSLNRFIRILLAGLLALAVTLVTGLTFYLIDERFLISLSGEVTMDLIIPVVVATILGFLMYFAGWWMIVGYRGDTLKARHGILWYLGVGLVALIVSLIWIIWIIIEL